MRAVVFDFDGTLYYGTARLNAWCFSRALKERGLPPLSAEEAHWTVGLALSDICQRLLGDSSPDAIQSFSQSVLSFVPSYIRAHVRPNQDLTLLLFRLSGLAKLALLSNANKGYLLPMLDALGIRRRFDCIWAHRTGVSKASAIPEILNAMDAWDAVMVGDRAEDIEAGKANGLKIVGVRNPAFPEEVDGADHVVGTRRQMKEILLQMLEKRG